MSQALYARRVHARHPGADFDVIRDVSLQVRGGEILAIVGPNGSGKSTLLSVMGGEIRPRSGRVEVHGSDLFSLRRNHRARVISRLPQDPVPPEGLSVEALVACGRHPHRPAFASISRDDERAIAKALEVVSLSDFRRRNVGTLSGGERRRAWIAMVLAQETEILLLDEPTAALDLRYQWELLELLERLNRDLERTIVVSLHDLDQAARLAHRVAIMHNGRLYACDDSVRVIEEEMLRDVFRIEAQVVQEHSSTRVQVLGPADPVRSL